MKKAIYFFMLMLLIIMAGCGTEEDEPATSEAEEMETTTEPEEQEEASREGELESTMDNLELNVSATQNSTNVEFVFELVNKNEEPVDLMFSSGQQYEIELYQDDTLIYQYSEGKMFTEALIEESLKSGEMKKWTETWELTESIETGEYQAEMTLLPTEINGQKLEDTPLQQSIQLSLEEAETTDTEDEHFRSIEVNGEDGDYSVTGEIDTSIGDVYYEIEDGHNYLVEETEVPVEGEGWQPFEINVTISEDLLPKNGAVVMLLYTEDRTEQYPVQLELLP